MSSTTKQMLLGSPPPTRGGTAEHALQAYVQVAGNRDEPEETQVTDLLADLMHFCHSRGLDFQEMLGSAQHHFDEEVEEEAGEEPKEGD